MDTDRGQSSPFYLVHRDVILLLRTSIGRYYLYRGTLRWIELTVQTA